MITSHIPTIMAKDRVGGFAVSNGKSEADGRRLGITDLVEIAQ